MTDFPPRLYLRHDRCLIDLHVFIILISQSGPKALLVDSLVE
jgi:hypothetical protein